MRRLLTEGMNAVYLKNLDEKDNQIIALLLENARLTYSEIGEQIGLSRVAVKNRVKLLEEQGIIIRIRVNSNNLLDLFNTAYDRRFSIVGSKENFGILITRPTHTFPGAISGSNGLVRYLCQFSGTLEGIPFSSRPQKKISKQTYFSKMVIIKL